jgi:predicted RNase H-like HicB family nuclease
VSDGFDVKPFQKRISELSPAGRENGKAILFYHFDPMSIFCNFVFQIDKMKPKKNKHIDFTAIIEKSDDGWYVGQLEELPEVISQGKTLVELKQNLQDALEMVISNARETTLSLYQGKKYIRRKLSFV